MLVRAARVKFMWQHDLIQMNSFLASNKHDDVSQQQSRMLLHISERLTVCDMHVTR